MTSTPTDKSLGSNKPITLQKDSSMVVLSVPQSNSAADSELASDVTADNKYTETPFMPKMGNATLRAELGRASWKLFHTVLARYPDNPTENERETLNTYLYLFAQVYPCGDCARHFIKLLEKYPPQTGSRKTAALWGCDVHNKVNKVLKKPEYDCTKILENYDCGCGTDETEKDYTLGNQSMEHLRGISIDEKEEEPQLGG
ncbi:uncharacterized protein J8A68_003114 [[Candida] subhashii]|uniref:thiol oxidase n=1 Tax=[Candida] subhashii TaxID=561895 RepID=A0A8J5QF61_9ASCO|nr:uncharacterized protein J8A68_003114 [[Candida] subhashii]KAG7663366.1 hypothetical protein J8A68_003114 [[Candida] subhashii]